MPAVPIYFVIQANVKKSAKMNAVPTPTQIHIVPVSPCARKGPDPPTVPDPAAMTALGADRCLSP